MADVEMEGSSSDEMSDFDDIDISEEDINAIAELEKALEENPNLYEKHLEYISMLGKAKMKTKLRAARQAMHARFPLSPDLWVQWLTDEHASKADAEFMISLYNLATQDYLSVTIWEMYLRFLKSSKILDANAIRQTCEEAVRIGGLHVSEGHKLWNLYREIQLELDPGTVSKDQEILKRQLQVPLLENKSMLEQLLNSNTNFKLSEDSQKDMQRANAMLDSRRSSEASVSEDKAADTDLLAAFAAYINLEIAAKDHARVECLYERALTRFPVTHLLWQQYAQYMEHYSKDHALIQRIYARAVRNCPWIAALWSRSLRALERAGASNEAHLEVYNQALSSGLENPDDYIEIGLARLDFLRRTSTDDYTDLKETFSTVSSLIQTYFPEYVDRTCRIPSYWAMCLLELEGDHDTAKQVWEAALDSKLNMYSDAVLAYIDFEVSAKRYTEARSIFRKYHRRPMHGRGSLAIANAWLRFERERGSAEELLQAFIKTEPIFSEAASQETGRSHPHLAQQADEAIGKMEKPKLTKAEQKALRQQKDPNFKPNKDQKESKKNQKEPRKGKKEPKAKSQNKEASETKEEPTAKATQEPPGLQAQAVAEPRSVGEASGAADPVTGERQDPQTSGPAGVQQTSGKRKTQGLGFAEKTGKKAKSEVDNTAAATSNLGGFTSAGEQDLSSAIPPESSASIQESKLTQDLTAADKSHKDTEMKPQDNSTQPPKGNMAAPAPRPAQAAKEAAQGAEPAALGPGPSALGQSSADPQAQLGQLSAGPAESGSIPNRFKRTAYVKKIAEKSTQEDIQNLMAGCGRIVDLSMPLNPRTSKHRGFAYIRYAEPESLHAAIRLNGTNLDGHELQITAASQEVHEDARNAFVLNLPHTVTEDGLRDLFTACGPVQSIRLPLDKDTSQPRGFAYVEFQTRDGLQNAVDMTGVELEGKSLQIKVSEPRGGWPMGGRGGPPMGGRGPFREGRDGPAFRGRGGGRGGRAPFRPPGGFSNNSRDRPGPGEPLGGGRGGRPNLDLEGGGAGAPQPRMPNGGTPKPKSNADFRAMLNKR